MWWSSRKGSWPPRRTQPTATERKSEGSRETQGTARYGSMPPAAAGEHYSSGHASWHEEALPNHVRRPHRAR